VGRIPFDTVVTKAMVQGQPEDRDLFDGLAICAVGSTHRAVEVDVPFLSRGEIGDIADLLEEKSLQVAQPRLWRL
jgi:hypothetical protein